MAKTSAKYRRLRAKLREYDIDQEYLAQVLNRSRGHVSFCLNGRAEWLMSEVYTICKLCQIPTEEMHIYFPPGGVDVENARLSTMPDVAKFFVDLAELVQGYAKEARV